MSVTIVNTLDSFQLSEPSLYTDNFESYSEGSLNGQGFWVVALNTFYVHDTGTIKYAYPNTLSGYCLAYYNKTFNENQRSKITIGSLTANYIGPAVRISSNGNDCYFINVANNRRWVEGRTGGTPFDVVAAAYYQAPSVGDTFEIRVSGSTITCYRNGSIDTGFGDALSPATGTAGVYTDTRVTGGRPGLVGYSNTQYSGADDWEGANI